MNAPKPREWPSQEDRPIVKSSEQFGDGWMTLRHTRFRRDVAEFLADASPRDLSLTVPPDFH